jgi:hypothetical protein
MIIESERCKGCFQKIKTTRVRMKMKNAVRKGEKRIRVSLICLKRRAFSKSILKCRYAMHTASMFVLGIGYRLKYLRFSIIKKRMQDLHSIHLYCLTGHDLPDTTTLCLKEFKFLFPHILSTKLPKRHMLL